MSHRSYRTSRAWTRHHHRGDTLRAAAAAAETRLDGRLPTDVDGIAETFHDELDLLGALVLRWHTRLAGRLDRALAQQPLDLDAAVIEAWQTTAGEMPGVRLVIDHHREHPLDQRMAAALDKAARKEQALLAVAAGRAVTADAAAAPVGALLESRARASRPAVPRRIPVPQHRSHAGLFHRLRAALAA